MNGYQQARRMRRELGRELKERRRAAGLSQSELARLTGRSRSLVSTLESATGGAAGLGFWRRCDEVLRTGGRFARRWLQIQREVEAERTRAAAARRDAAGRPPGDSPASALRALAAGSLGAAEAEVAYQRLGWPLVPGPGGPALRTGEVADALEVPRRAGWLAITWWLDSGGAADPVRGLPGLPSPREALAVVDAGDTLYFLARAGSSPWPDAAAPRRPAGRVTAPVTAPVIGWHSAGGAVPLPPAASRGGRPARWEHVPGRASALASPFALLDLLAKALAATAPEPGGITLTPGVLVVPAPRLP